MLFLSLVLLLVSFSLDQIIEADVSLHFSKISIQRGKLKEIAKLKPDSSGSLRRIVEV